MSRLRDINDVMNAADAVIDAQAARVTQHLRKVLVAGGIPEDIAENYSAEPNHGGEWLLNDENGELASHDYQLLSNEHVVELVRYLEGL